MHTHEGVASGEKNKQTKPKVSNQHQLAPIQNTTPPQKKEDNKAKKAEDIKVITLVLDRDREMMDITMKIMLDSTHGPGRRGGRGLGHRPWTNNDNGQSQNQNSQRGRGGNQNRGRGHEYNPQQGQHPAYDQGYQPAQGQYPYKVPPQEQPQNMMPPPPPYDPNWQL